MKIQNALKQFLLAAFVFVLYTVVSRVIDAHGTTLDWMALFVSSSVPPLMFKELRLSFPQLLFLVVMNAALLFFCGFWIIGFLFGEGL